MSHSTDSPLRGATQASWTRLVLSANPPALLVAIRGLLGPRLRSLHDAEDVLQETLLHAWRDRSSMEWRGIGSFRRWLLQIARHRIHDLSDRAAAVKRGGGLEQRVADLGTSLGEVVYAGPAAATTPSRVATDRELAADLEAALDSVPVESREVVRQRLFQEQELAEIATSMGLGVEAVRYRLRHGLDAYQRALRRRRGVADST